MTALSPPLQAPEAIDITALTTAARLLVALDFDGVIAPLQDDPSTSTPVAESATAVEALAALPGTAVGYISGRDVAALKDLSRAPARALFVGSHGVEQDFSGLAAGWPAGFPATTSAGSPDPDDPFRYSAAPDAGERALLERLDAEFERIAAATPSTGHGELRIERKPLGATFHTRGCSPERAEFFTAELRRFASAHPELRSLTGHDMVEFGVRMHTKGDGLDTMIERAQATAALYIGDDTTDEDAFAHLADRQDSGFPGLSIRVGTADTRAQARLGSTDDVAAFLTRLARERAAHVGG